MAIQSDGITPTPPPQDAGGESDWSAALLRENKKERQICVRLDAERFAMLEALAVRNGVTPTTMARMLVHRGLRGEELGWE